MVIIDIRGIVKGGAAIVQVPLAVLLTPPPTMGIKKLKCTLFCAGTVLRRQDLTYVDGPRTERINPLNPHDALKHHFISLKTDLIFLQPRVLE